MPTHNDAPHRSPEAAKTDDTTLEKSTLPSDVHKALRALIKLEISGSLGRPIKVFGSLNTSKENPFDVDCFIDARDISFSHENLKPFSPLIALAKKHYGSIDPFIIFKNALYVRSDTATHWIPARNAKELEGAMTKVGVSIMDTRHSRAILREIEADPTQPAEKGPAQSVRKIG